jgi:hypothetical protein
MHRPRRHGTDDASGRPKPRRRFTLRVVSFRHHRDPERSVNLRAGVEPPHGYPFEPRF